MIHREDRNDIAVLRMEHGKANAVDTDLFTDVGAALDAVESSNARALVLTGTGSMFSAGVDLFRVLKGGAPYLAEFLPLLSTIVRRLFTFPRPIVAAVNGHAIAGGCVMAAACDRRIMNRDKGKIGVTELLVGVPFPADALEALRFLPAGTPRPKPGLLGAHPERRRSPRPRPGRRDRRRRRGARPSLPGRGTLGRPRPRCLRDQQTANSPTGVRAHEDPVG